MKAFLTALICVLSVTSAQARTRLTSDLVLYADCATGNDANNGTTPALAFKTGWHAADHVYSNYDLDGWSITIRWGDPSIIPGSNGDQRPCNGGGGASVNGLVTGQSAVNRNLYGTYSLGIVNFQGNPNNNSAVKILGIHAALGASVWVSNVTIDQTGYADWIWLDALRADWGATIFFTGVNFGPMQAGGAHMRAVNNAYIQNVGVYGIIGGAALHAVASNGATIYLNDLIVLIGNPFFSVAFAYAGTFAQIFNIATVNGSARGLRCDVHEGFIYGAAGLPGNPPPSGLCVLTFNPVQ